MKAREFLHALDTPFHPRTPNAALKAAEKSIISPELYEYRAVSVVPLHPDHVSLEELDRILGQPNRDLDTNLFLVDILEKLLDHEDPEVALFAAESLSLVENGYNKEIEGAKKEMEEDYDAEHLRKLARLYTELALLNNGKGAIKRFYLREAFLAMRNLETLTDQVEEDFSNKIKLLVSLGLYDQARNLLDDEPPSPEILLLRMEVEFLGRNFDRVFKLGHLLGQQSNYITTEDLKLVRFWMGHETG